MPASCTVETEDQENTMIQNVRKNRAKGLVIKYTWESFRKRKLTQNALFQVWSREITAFLLKKPEKLVAEEEHEDVKKALKSKFYNETGFDWVLRTSKNHLTGAEKKVLKSTAKYDPSEMYIFMEWVQAGAADMGLILEAKGEFQKMKQEQVT